MELTNTQLVDLLITNAIENAIKYYGIEGCEEAICRVYSQNPTAKTRFLTVFRQKYRKNS